MECEPYIEAVSHRLRKLTEANHSLAEIESLDDLFPRLLDLAKEVTDGEASSLMLYNSESHLLEFASIKDDVMGDRADDVLKSSVKLKMGEGIAGWVAQNRKAVMVKDAQRDPRFSKRADAVLSPEQCSPYLSVTRKSSWVYSMFSTPGKNLSSKQMISPFWKALLTWPPSP